VILPLADLMNAAFKMHAQILALLLAVQQDTQINQISVLMPVLLALHVVLKIVVIQSALVQ